MLQQVANGLVAGCILALFAMGFTILFGVFRALNMAQGAIFTWGALIGLALMTDLGVPFWLAILIGTAGAAVINVILGMGLYERVARRPDAEIAILLLSIGAANLLVAGGQSFRSVDIGRFPADGVPQGAVEVGPVTLSHLELIIVLVSVAVTLALFLYLYLTPDGLRLRAVSANDELAGSLGVNRTRVGIQIYLLAGAVAGLAGILIGAGYNSVHFLMGQEFLLLGIVAVVLGGLGRVVGALLASLALGLVQSFSVGYLPPGWGLVIIWCILLATFIVRPTGLFGSQSSIVRTVRK